MSHRITQISTVDVPDVGQRYRYLCLCTNEGDYQTTSDAAIEQWVEHVTGRSATQRKVEAITVAQEALEIVRLANQLGAKVGLTGLEWIRQLAAIDTTQAAPLTLTSAQAGCPDCARTDTEISVNGHGPGCHYATKAEMDADGFPE